MPLAGNARCLLLAGNARCLLLALVAAHPSHAASARLVLVAAAAAVATAIPHSWGETARSDRQLPWYDL